MYYSYAEKKSKIFSAWSMREVALDCTRRYLYYSEPVKESMVVPCAGPPIVVYSHSKEGFSGNSRRQFNSSRTTEIVGATPKSGEEKKGSNVNAARSRTVDSNVNSTEMHSVSSCILEESSTNLPSPIPVSRAPPDAAVLDRVSSSTGGGERLQNSEDFRRDARPLHETVSSSSSPAPSSASASSVTAVGNSERWGSPGGSVGGVASTSPLSRSDARERWSTSVATPPPPPHSPHAVVWKKKIKVDCLACAAHNHEFKTYDPHLKENDFYQIEIGGEARELITGEIPPPEPLLCPSTGLSGMPGRCVLENEEFIRDPFFQKELYDSLKILFSTIRVEQENAALREHRVYEPPTFRTITSPRVTGGTKGKNNSPQVAESSLHSTPVGDPTRGDGGAFPSASSAVNTSTNSSSLAPSTSSHFAPSSSSVSFAGKILGQYVERIHFTLRFRTEYEFRRFLYAVKTVLGYDKLTLRPYYGFPPYDPRNGIILAHLPLYRWHSFKSLQKSMIYSFVRGDLYGRTADNTRTVILLKGGFLCLTHDDAIVYRDSGAAYCKMCLVHVEHFRYNYNCTHPYCAFISDVGHTDIFFVPQPPLFGEDSISRFNAKEEVMRIHHLVYEASFSSLVIRRVIDLNELPYSNILTFIEAYIKEFELIRVVVLDPQAQSSLSTESFPVVWSEAQEQIRFLSHARRQSVSETAIPLYDNHTNHLLSAKKLETIRQRLAGRTRSVQQDEVTGISVAEGDDGSENFSTSDDEGEVPACFQDMAEYTTLSSPTTSEGENEIKKENKP